MTTHKNWGSKLAPRPDLMVKRRGGTDQGRAAWSIPTPAATLSAKCRDGQHKNRCTKLSCPCPCHS